MKKLLINCNKLKYIYSFILCFQIILIFSQKKELYYSQYSQKYGSSLSNISLFIKYAANQNAVAIIDNCNFDVQQEIVFKNLRNVDIIFRNSKFFLIKRFQGAFLNFYNIDGLTITGLDVDLGGNNLKVYEEKDYPTLYNVGVIVKKSKNITIADSKFYNLYTRSINITESSGNIELSNNYFNSNKQYQRYLLEHVVIGSSPNAVVDISDNKFINREYTNPDFGICSISGYGLGKNGGKVTVRNNSIDYSGRNNDGAHRLYAIDFYDDCDNLSIENNILSNIMWGAIRFNGSAENVIIDNNKITIKNPDETGSITSTTTERNKNFRNIQIINNIIKSLNNLNTAIYLQNPFKNLVPEGIKINNNFIYNSYVGILFNGFFQGIEVNNNSISGNLASQGIVFTLKNYEKNNSVISILKNKIDTQNSAISLNSHKNNYNKFNIFQNNISNTTAIGDYGIIINKGVKGVVNLTENSIKNYGVGVYVREKNVIMKHIVFYGNKKNILKD